jgi:mono/diheme cytochrome c family protein
MPGREIKDSEWAWTFAIIGLVLLTGTLSYFRHGPITAQRGTPDDVPSIDPAMVPLATGEEPLPELFIRSGCSACHTIPGIPGAEGRAGPKLVLGSTGTQRLADPNYRGQATTVLQYIQESILTPGIYVVPGYPDRVMPQWYGKKLSAAAVDKIAAYLEQLKDEGSLNAAPPILK